MITDADTLCLLAVDDEVVGQLIGRLGRPNPLRPRRSSPTWRASEWSKSAALAFYQSRGYLPQSVMLRMAVEG